MSLPNKEDGEKLYAFEVNNIVKALIELNQKIIQLEGQGMVYVGSANDVSDVIDVPDAVNFAVVVITASSSFPANAKVEIFLSKVGKTTGTITMMGAATNSSGASHETITVTATWSGNEITISEGGNGASGVSGTAYFYR